MTASIRGRTCSRQYPTICRTMEHFCTCRLIWRWTTRLCQIFGRRPCHGQSLPVDRIKLCFWVYAADFMIAEKTMLLVALPGSLNTSVHQQLYLRRTDFIVIIETGRVPTTKYDRMNTILRGLPVIRVQVEVRCPICLSHLR
jgi:hypothetical protein